MPKESAERDYRKPCTLCETPRDVLVRCQIDETGQWHFVCVGACWKRVSGGVQDGDADEEHQYYRYGGMWKNKHEAVSAKKPKKSKKVAKQTQSPHSAEASSSDSDAVADDGLPAGAVPSVPDMAEQWDSNGKDYTRNDRVTWDDQIWICRKSHKSDDHWTPAKAYSLWKTED